MSDIQPFRNGQSLKGIALAETNPMYDPVTVCGDGPHDAKTITVIMEAGQTMQVAWAIVETNDGEICKVNLTYCESVTLQ